METTDLVTAVYNAARDSVLGRLSPQSYGRRIILMSVTGPGRSTLRIYRGYSPNDAGRISSVYPADVRNYDAASGGGAPIVIRAGEAATFEWTGGNTGVGQTANCNVISEVTP